MQSTVSRIYFFDGDEEVLRQRYRSDFRPAQAILVRGIEYLAHKPRCCHFHYTPMTGRKFWTFPCCQGMPVARPDINCCISLFTSILASFGAMTTPTAAEGQ